MRALRVGWAWVGMALSVALAPVAFAVPQMTKSLAGILTATSPIPDWSFTPVCPAG